MKENHPRRVLKKGEKWVYEASINGGKQDVILPWFEHQYVGTHIHSTDPERTAHTFHAPYFADDPDQTAASTEVGKSYLFFVKKITHEEKGVV